MDYLNKIEHIGIVGTGLIGSSIGLSLKKSGFRGKITGIDLNKKELSLARSIGAIDNCYEKIDSKISGFQLLLIAVPISNIQQIFKTIALYDHDDLIITDVGSTKSTILQLSEQILPDPGRFIGSHPMAGNEISGSLGAKNRIFRGKTCILTENIKTYPFVYEFVRDMWKSLGMNVITMTAEEHDVCTAATSHLPHAVSVLLINSVIRLGGIQTASTGFKDVSRLASSNPTMRLDIMIDNRNNLIESLKVFSDEINMLINILFNKEDEELLNLLNTTKVFRDNLKNSGKVGDSEPSLQNTYIVN